MTLKCCEISLYSKLCLCWTQTVLLLATIDVVWWVLIWIASGSDLPASFTPLIITSSWWWNERLKVETFSSFATFTDIQQDATYLCSATTRLSHLIATKKKFSLCKYLNNVHLTPLADFLAKTSTCLDSKTALLPCRRTKKQLRALLCGVNSNS